MISRFFYGAQNILLLHFCELNSMKSSLRCGICRINCICFPCVLPLVWINRNLLKQEAAVCRHSEGLFDTIRHSNRCSNPFFFHPWKRSRWILKFTAYENRLRKNSRGRHKYILSYLYTQNVFSARQLA